MQGINWVRFAGLASVLLLSACAGRQGTPAKSTAAPAGAQGAVVSAPACQPQSQTALVGTWYAAYTPRGVGGQLQTLTVLRADGTMSYETQLKMGKRMRPGLRESGCWRAAGGAFVMQTLKSTGEEVDFNDPIYTNTYRIEKVDGTTLSLREDAPGGQRHTAKKMPAGFKLPAR